MKSVRYIKESNDNFTYGKFYRVIYYWGDFGDYVMCDDKMDVVRTYKHNFEDWLYLYQSDLHEMTQITDDLIEIKTNHGTTIVIKAEHPSNNGAAYLEITEKENE